MTRLALWQFLVHPADDRSELRLLERSPDAEPVEVECRKITGRLASQVLVLGALDHPEECLIRPVAALARQPLVLNHTSLRPLEGSLQRSLLVLPGVHEGRALIEREHDVGADLVLHLHRHLWSEPVE